MFTKIFTTSAFGTWRDKATILDKQESQQKFQGLIVGDTPTDVRAGQSAGLITCAIIGGMAPEYDLRHIQPTYVVKTLSSIMNIVPLIEGRLRNKMEVRNKS